MTETTNEKSLSPMMQVLRQRNFRLLWIGEGISLLGDQFYLIALPWLTLQMTRDAVSVGGVLAAAAIPRALFMLVGGALTDRFSPRNVMLVSNLLRMIVVLVLALLVFSGLAQLWMLYLLAFIFGVVDAFFFPAQSTMVPRLVKKENLQIGNSIIQGTAQLSRFGGPVLAGALIALLGSETGAEAMPGLRGIAYAFGIDAITFLVSAITLWMISLPAQEKDFEDAPQKEGVWSSIRAGIVSVWNDVGLRNLFFVIIGVNVLVNGPLLVGIPVLADTRFTEGAAAFGMIISGYGGGNLLGTVLAGVLKRPASKYISMLFLATTSIMGIGIALLGLATSLYPAVIISLVMGIANGYITILFITWLQARTPQSMLGRLMSLLMFAAMGLNPISMALSGFFIELNATVTFVFAGVLMITVVLFAALNPAVRSIDYEVVETSVGES